MQREDTQDLEAKAGDLVRQKVAIETKTGDAAHNPVTESVVKMHLDHAVETDDAELLQDLTVVKDVARNRYVHAAETVVAKTHLAHAAETAVVGTHLVRAAKTVVAKTHHAPAAETAVAKTHLVPEAVIAVERKRHDLEVVKNLAQANVQVAAARQVQHRKTTPTRPTTTLKHPQKSLPSWWKITNRTWKKVLIKNKCKTKQGQKRQSLLYLNAE